MILLVRHCQPIIDYSSCNYKEANKRIADYNNTENIKIEEIDPLREHIMRYTEG
jgi:hypothetical protein